MKIPLIPAKVMKNWKSKIHIPRSLYRYQMSSSPFHSHYLSISMQIPNPTL